MHLFCFYEGFIRGGIQRVFVVVVIYEKYRLLVFYEACCLVGYPFSVSRVFSLASESVLLLVYCVFFFRYIFRVIQYSKHWNCGPIVVLHCLTFSNFARPLNCNSVSFSFSRFQWRLLFHHPNLWIGKKNTNEKRMGSYNTLLRSAVKLCSAMCFIFVCFFFFVHPVICTAWAYRIPLLHRQRVIYLDLVFKDVAS